MAKKRKLRSSEPEPSKAPEPEPSQQQPSEEEEPQQQIHEAEPEQEQTQLEPIQEDDLQPVKQEQADQDQDMAEDEPQEQREAKEEEENNEDEETLNASNDAVTLEPGPPEANGEEDADGEEDAAEEEDDGGEEDLEEEPLDKLIEPFSKEQLVVLVREAAEKYPDFINNVRKLADADPAHRKIFVHGLGWDATAETLTNVFGKYGEIEDCKAVCDKVSGKSKGYAFILFKHRSGAQKALKQPQKKIGSRTTSCQLASAGPVPAPPPAVPPVSEYTQRKIFVSNVSADMDPRKLLEFFSKYGEVEEGPLGLDKQTGKPKGFALFVYKTIESAKKALEEPYKNFEGHTLHCQKAIDGPKPSKPYHHHNQYYQTPHPTRKEKGKYSSGGSGQGHLMAPSGPAVGFNPGVAAAAAAAQGLNPALGQALSALLATQGAGLGITNLLGGLGGAVNQNVPPVAGHGMQGGYGNQAGASYGSQPGMQGGYQNPQMGPTNAVRSQQGGPPYMGH